MKEILLEIRYFERELCQKPSKKLALFFLLNPVPSNRQKCQKQTMPGISGQVLFRLRNKFTSICLLVIYCLTKCDGVI